MNRRVFQPTNRLSACLLALGLFALNEPAIASDQVYISDASTLKWQISSQKAWLRNLHEYDATFLGCCYNFWIDLTTDEGKAMWSAILAAVHASDSIYLHAVSKTTASEIVSLGRY